MTCIQGWKRSRLARSSLDKITARLILGTSQKLSLAWLGSRLELAREPSCLLVRRLEDRAATQRTWSAADGGGVMEEEGATTQRRRAAGLRMGRLPRQTGHEWIRIWVEGAGRESHCVSLALSRVYSCPGPHPQCPWPMGLCGSASNPRAERVS